MTSSEADKNTIWTLRKQTGPSLTLRFGTEHSGKVCSPKGTGWYWCVRYTAWLPWAEPVWSLITSLQGPLNSNFGHEPLSPGVTGRFPFSFERIRFSPQAGIQFTSSHTKHPGSSKSVLQTLCLTLSANFINIIYSLWVVWRPKPRDSLASQEDSCKLFSHPKSNCCFV